MSNPTINVNLSSLATGTVPTVTSEVDVVEGGQVDISAVWPDSASNTIQCNLNFQGVDDQDPITGVSGGSSTFDVTRPSATQSGVTTLNIAADASIETDTYILTLSIDGVNYATDPSMKVHGGP